MKMFKKEKITEKDVGLLEDAFVFLCHAVADESHCLGNYMSTGNEQDLKDLEEARRLRTFVADKITEGIKNQNWCRIKHICGKAMTCQELITRYLSMKDMEKAKELAEEYKKLYLEYLKILGVTEKNMKLKSSA